MNTIDVDRVSSMINRCYLDYDPNWQENYSKENHINGFKYYVERTAGLKLDFYPETKNGRYGYRLDRVEIIDEPTFTMWMLKWS